MKSLRWFALLILCFGSAAFADEHGPSREVVGKRTTEGVPPIAADLYVSLEQYHQTRGARLGGWLADGSLLITTRFGDTEQVHRVAAPLGMREQITFGTEPISQVASSPHHNQFVYLQDQGGVEFWQLRAFNLQTRQSRVLTAGGRTRNDQPVFSADGQRVAFTSTERNGTDSDIWVADLQTGERRRITGESGAWYPFDFSPDGQSLLIMRYVSITDSRPARVELKTGDLEYLPVEGEHAAVTHMRFDPSGQGVWFVSDEGTEFRTLRWHDFSTSKVESVSNHISWDVEFIDVSADGRYLAFVTNEGGISKVHVMSLPDRKVLALPTLPTGVIETIAFDHTGAQLAINLNAATSPRDIWVFDLTDLALTRWTQSEVGGLDPDRFIAPTLIEYPTFDRVRGQQRQIPAFFYRPEGEGPFPVIVRIHGGPEGQEQPVFSPFIQYLVKEEKIAVIMPNVRGSAGYGKTWLDLDNGILRKDSVKDVGAVFDWIKQQPELDAKAVGVTGGSYGGYMVLAAMIDYPESIRAGSELFGISDFRTFLTHTESYRRDLRRAEYGDERQPSMQTFFDAIAPLKHAGKIRAPLLVAQGAGDPRVPQSESEQIVKAVREAGQEVWYILFADEGHGFTRKPNIDFNNAANVLFWRKHLGRNEP